MNFTLSIIVNILIFLIGALLGNHFAIGRDKRKEFNILIEPIRSNLIKSIKNPGSNIGLNDVNIIDIKNALPFYKRRGFNNAIIQWYKSISKENRKGDGMGGFDIIEPQKIISASKELLKYLKKK